MDLRRLISNYVEPQVADQGLQGKGTAWGQGPAERELRTEDLGQGTGGRGLGTGNSEQDWELGTRGRELGAGKWGHQRTWDRELGTRPWGQGTGGRCPLVFQKSLKHYFASSRAYFAAGAGGTMGRRWQNAR